MNPAIEEYRSQGGVSHSLERNSSHAQSLSGFPQLPEWLHSLEGCQKLVEAESKTPDGLVLYKRVLGLWREAGYPHPGEWPDTANLRIGAYTLEWITQHKDGFERAK